MMRTYWMNAMDPFTDLTQLEEWMDQTLEQVLSSFTPGVAPSNGFVPAIDMLDGVDHLTVRVALPGLKENDINVTLEGNVLTIRGERRLPEGIDLSKFSLMECPYGTFVRTVTLPDTMDPNAINAVYTNGILEITVGKRAEAKPKQIPVTVAQPQLAGHATA
jgi:HSP20 family protein